MASAAQADPKIIDGKAISAIVRQELTEQVAQLKATTGVVPGLAVVLVGECCSNFSFLHRACHPCSYFMYFDEVCVCKVCVSSPTQSSCS
jgi:hypothetical protein